MCGITGIVLPAGAEVEEGLLARMTETLRHRGPDASGLLVDRNVGLGHRRLAIIDPSPAGNQPLANEDGAVATVLNGMIYNFKDLRRELAAAGHRFRSQADTEVLVHGFEDLGAELVPRLRGMFALALYDRRARRLLLARDRVGKKPLYYSRGTWGLAFASELKALLELPWISRDLDLKAVGEYQVYGATVGARTIFKDVRKLPPGHTLALSTVGRELEPEIAPYWEFRPRPAESPDVEEWLAELDAALSEAVRLRMVSDVPLGAFLSGGIDSSLIAAHMCRLAPGRVMTFCIGFREAGFDESAHARAVAEHLGTEHHEETVTPDAVEILPDLVETYDEPFADPSAIPTYYVSKLIRRRVTVALSGDGGDELFIGYRRYLETALLDRLAALATPAGRRLAAAAARLPPPGSYLSRALYRLSRRGFDLYHHAMGFSEVFLPLLKPEVRRALGPGGDQPAAADFHRQPGLSLLARCQLMDVGNYLPDQMLVKVDRAAMRHSLEVRSPLLDQEVVAVAARMSADRQVRRREQKILLRRLAYRYVPRELLDRPKQGFDVPLGRWFRGPLAPMARRAIADDRSPMWDLFERREAARRLDDHLAGRSDSQKVLWRLLFFYLWAERFLGERPAA